MATQSDSPHPAQSGRWTLRDIVLFAALPLALSALAVSVTLALPGGPDASPRKLFSNCLINGIAAFTLAGVIQMWFTMGETRRADWERTRADQATERANKAIERANKAESSLAELRVQVANLTTTVDGLRRQLDERNNGHPQS